MEAVAVEAAVLSTVEARLLAASALLLSAPSLPRRDLRLVTIVVDTRTPLMPIDEFSGKRGATGGRLGGSGARLVLVMARRQVGCLVRCLVVSVREV